MSTYEVVASPEAERVLRAIAEARHHEDPDAFGALGHVPKVVRDAFARGLRELAREHDLTLTHVPIEVGRRRSRSSPPAGVDRASAERASEAVRLATRAAEQRRIDAREAMTLLAEAFPTLCGVAGVRPGIRRRSTAGSKPVHPRAAHALRRRSCSASGTATPRGPRTSTCTALRAKLAAHYAPRTTNKILCAVRGVLRECWRTGAIDTDSYQRALDVEGVRGSRLPVGRDLSMRERQAMLECFARDPHPARGARDARRDRDPRRHGRLSPPVSMEPTSTGFTGRPRARPSAA